MRKSWLLIPVSVLAFWGTLAAQTDATQAYYAAQTSYCKYLTEQAAAQRDLLRSPSLIAGPTQPDTGTPAQMVFGMSMSLADLRKASLTMQTARTGCDLNSAISEAQLHIYYAMAAIEREVLLHRLDDIARASAKLDSMASEQARLVEVHNLTRPAVYFLQSARERLDESRTAALASISVPYAANMSPVPLRVLIAQKQDKDLENQKALTKLQKENGWDFKVTAGGRSQLGQSNTVATVSSFGAYGAFTVSYNLGRRAANEHLDASVSPYMTWKTDRFDDIVQQAEVLRKQIEQTIALQQQQLSILLAHDNEITKSLSEFEDVDTSSAVAFRNQLLADRILLAVDIDDVQFRLDRLQAYLRDNF